MEIDLNRFRAAFYEEAGEHLENMEAGLLALESSGVFAAAGIAVRFYCLDGSNRVY